VKDYVELRAFWNKVYEQVWGKRKRKWEEGRDEKVRKAVKEME
jgi:hypothetical protein